MKKSGLLAATGILFLGMSSCIKDYDCNCVTTDPDGGTTANSTVVKGTKKTSETACDLLDNTAGSGDFEFKTECSI